MDGVDVGYQAWHRKSDRQQWVGTAGSRQRPAVILPGRDYGLGRVKSNGSFGYPGAPGWQWAMSILGVELWVDQKIAAGSDGSARPVGGPRMQ